MRQEHFKERRKQRKWVRLRIRKRDSNGAYYSVTHDLSLTDKEDFRKYLFLYFYSNVFPIFLYCTSRHYLSKSSLQLMLVSVFTSWNSENKKTYSAQVRLYCVLFKKIISVWWIISNWFDFNDQIYSNTRVPTQVNTSQHESTRINTSQHESTRVQHESNTSQHESTRVGHESTRVRHESTQVNTSPKQALDKILLKI